MAAIIKAACGPGLHTTGNANSLLLQRVNHIHACSTQTGARGSSIVGQDKPSK